MFSFHHDVPLRDRKNALMELLANEHSMQEQLPMTANLRIRQMVAEQVAQLEQLRLLGDRFRCLKPAPSLFRSDSWLIVDVKPNGLVSIEELAAEADDTGRVTLFCGVERLRSHEFDDVTHKRFASDPMCGYAIHFPQGDRLRILCTDARELNAVLQAHKARYWARRAAVEPHLLRLMGKMNTNFDTRNPNHCQALEELWLCVYDTDFPIPDCGMEGSPHHRGTIPDLLVDEDADEGETEPDTNPDFLVEGGDGGENKPDTQPDFLVEEGGGGENKPETQPDLVVDDEGAEAGEKKNPDANPGGNVGEGREKSDCGRETPPGTQPDPLVSAGEGCDREPSPDTKPDVLAETGESCDKLEEGGAPRPETNPGVLAETGEGCDKLEEGGTPRPETNPGVLAETREGCADAEGGGHLKPGYGEEGSCDDGAGVVPKRRSTQASEAEGAEEVKAATVADSNIHLDGQAAVPQCEASTDVGEGGGGGVRSVRARANGGDAGGEDEGVGEPRRSDSELTLGGVGEPRRSESESTLGGVVELRGRIQSTATLRFWDSLGFQSKLPQSDFRGMGMLGLHCLTYFAKTRKALIRALVEAQCARVGGYPFAAAGLNIVHLLVERLGFSQDPTTKSLPTTELLTFLCLLSVPKGAHAFEEVFCELCAILEQRWVLHNATYMDFPKVMHGMKRSFDVFLESRPTSLDELRQLPISKEQCEAEWNHISQRLPR